jgi:hypothetical protein
MNMLQLTSSFAPPALVWMAAWAVILPLTARANRPDIFFTITVDPSLRESPEGRKILGGFTRSVLLFSLAGLALALIGTFAGANPALRLTLMSSGIVIQMAGIINAFATARRRVRPYHVEASKQREVLLAPRRTRPAAGWLGQAGPLLILAAAAFWLWLKWNQAGQRTGEASTSWKSAFGSVIFGTTLCFVLSILFNSLARGVRRIHSSGSEAEKEARNLRSVLWLVLALEYCLALMFGFSNVMPLFLNKILNVALSIVCVAIVIVPLRNGQGGWRLRGRSSTSTQGQPVVIGDRTPDECWKIGLLYYNPNDPAVFVEKRFMAGWTVNMGNPRSWLVLGGIVIFIVTLFVVAH